MTDRADKMRYANLDASGALPEAHEGRFARALVWTIVAALVALLGWAAVTPVNEITTGRGKIITRASAERVEHPDGGVVTAIGVTAGTKVAVGDTLLEFDTSTLEREMLKLQASYDTLLAERERIAIVLEDRRVDPALSVLSALSSGEQLFWVEQDFVDAQLDLIDADSRAIRPAITILKARKASLAKELAILSDRLERSRSGQQSGVIARNTFEALEREHLQLERSVLDVKGDIAAQENALASNELRKAELLANRNREAAFRLADVREQIVDVSETMKEVSARIERATVRATVAGTVMEMTISNPKEFVAPGEMIAEIIPDQNVVEAEIEVSADQIGSVGVGMPARLKILSYDFTRYGEIVGAVGSVSPSSYLDDLGNSVFRVTIELPNDGVAPSLGNRAIVPGMTVTADILSDSKKILTYLLKPLRALEDRAFTEA